MKNQKNGTGKFINSEMLKLIAMLTMTIDHVGMALFPQKLILRMIGRLAFPIYCFLLVEGFFHTSGWKRYAGRLFLFAVLSELPFNLLVRNSLFCIERQNVFFTLLLGLLMLEGVSWITRKLPAWDTILVGCSIAVLTGALAEFLHTDYGAYGIFMIYFFYIYRKHFGLQVIAQCFINYIMGGIQYYGCLALIPIFFYNGKGGTKKLKYVFYSYYPIHFLLLYLVQQSIF